MSMNFEGEKKVTNKSRNQFHSSRTHWPVRSTKTWNRQLTVDDRRRSALESLKIHRNTWNNCSARRAEVRRWVAEFFFSFSFSKKTSAAALFVTRSSGHFVEWKQPISAARGILFRWMEIFSWCASDSYRFECIDRTPRTPPINGKFSFAAVAQSSGGNFWQFLRVNFRINLISRVNLIRIRLNFISFDSSLHALSKVFWVQVDWTKRSAAKSRKTWKWRKMARTTRYIFSPRRPTVSSNGVALKSKVVACSKSYRLVSNT